MKLRLRTWFAIGAVALLAGAAAADFNVRDHGTHHENASTGLKVNSTGDLTVEESAPAMDANLTFQSIISTSLAVAAGDSSAILDTHRMRLGMLLIKTTPAAGAGNANTRFAVQLRLHLNGNSDSLSTFVIYPYGSTGTLTATAIPDTLNNGHLLTGSTSAPWSGEIVVTDDLIRHGAGGTSALFPYPNGIAVPLASVFGRDIYAPYLSVRIRNLSGRTSAVAVHLVGTPL